MTSDGTVLALPRHRLDDTALGRVTPREGRAELGVQPIPHFLRQGPAAIGILGNRHARRLSIISFRIRHGDHQSWA